ncbi:DUF4179 domain-containing protein [Paenibacillus sp. LMG 31456]|uniref:DUF4179 domain-containing protein n=1 Tax=Paenibacillus foliorum TaxID=2654974 RepID=A0A972GSG2_9BACL|nr:DUF4179 domain-containing protein [Paenibacillus foliorum]NOU95907.1 DUF4179 domain-containing protein [Paenibacillus foliorum]
MHCLSPVEMEQYILDDPTFHKQQVAEHIVTCLRCRSLYQEQLEEQALWSQELFEKALPDSFTTKVMAALEQEELVFDDKKDPMIGTMAAINMEQNEGGSIAVKVSKTPSTLVEKGLFHRKGAIFWKLTLGVASLLILFSTVILYSVPTLAETLRSLFTHNNIDIGLLRAQEFGLVEHPNIKVKDNGYTVMINEAVADPTRVVVALQLFGPDGKHDRNRLVFGPENSIKIKDDQGKIVGNMSDIGATNDFYYLVAFFSEPLQTDRITIEGNLTQLGNKGVNIPIQKGRWNFDFSVDMKEANKKTTITPLKGSYTAPDGMTIRLKRLTRMVQGVRLELDTELSEEALARSPGELWKQQGLKFHLEDMQGGVIQSVNARKVAPGFVMTQSHHPGDKPGLMHWSYTFEYLPRDSPYTFVFDGYFVSERDDASVQFEPSKLKVQPVPFRSDGDELMLRDFTVESPPNTNGEEVEGALHLDGKLRNEYSQSEWRLKALNGKEYTISMRGASTTEGASGWKDGYIQLGGPNLGGLFEFRAQGLTEIPDRLQLTRTVVDRLYTNVDWSVPIKEDSK